MAPGPARVAKVPPRERSAASHTAPGAVVRLYMERHVNKLSDQRLNSSVQKVCVPFQTSPGMFGCLWPSGHSGGRSLQIGLPSFLACSWLSRLCRTAVPEMFEVPYSYPHTSITAY